MNDQSPKMVREKRILWRKDSRRIAWIVHTERFAIEFHIQVYEDKSMGTLLSLIDGRYEGQPCSPFGFEVHSRDPLYEYSPDPSHEDCTVLGGRCWHDGSSMAATEFFEWWDQSDEWAFRECEKWARNRMPEVEA